MNRRSMISRSALTAGALALAGPVTLMQVACGSTKQLVKWTGLVIGALRDLSPILAGMDGTVPIVALVAKAIPIAERLKKAFEDNDHAKTLDLLNNLIAPGGVFAQIADLVGNLTDERKRLVQGLLAIAQTFLRLIAANIEEEIPASATAAARALNAGAVRAVENAASPDKIASAFKLTRF